MAAELNKNIFMGLKAPTAKSLLVSIPMDMYRIQTRNFKDGLNFFQKAVLKFKLMPSISNERIAELLDLDVRLINRIEKDLRRDDLLDESGQLTESGKKVREESESLIVDENSKPQLGYIFKYEGGNTLFPYYQRDVDYAESNGEVLLYNNSEKTIELPFKAPLLRVETEKDTVPNEQEIFRSIKSSKHRLSIDLDVDTSSLQNLRITFLPSPEPVPVNVFTYIYLPLAKDRGNEEIYEDEWQVLDPFGAGDSIELKNYLQNEVNKDRNFKKCLSEAFGTATTMNHIQFLEAEELIDKTALEEMISLFGANIVNVDSNLQLYIKYVIAYRIRMEHSNYSRIDQSDGFCINLQKTLETLLKSEQLDREDVFMDVFNNYSVPPLRKHASQRERDEWNAEQKNAIEQRKEDLKVVLSRHPLLTCSHNTANVLSKKCSSTWYLDSTKDSLLDVYTKFLLSFFIGETEDCKIFEAMSDVNLVYEISQIRNRGGHGRIADEDDPIVSITKEDADKYFNFLVKVIKDYIQ